MRGQAALQPGSHLADDVLAIKVVKGLVQSASQNPHLHVLTGEPAAERDRHPGVHQRIGLRDEHQHGSAVPLLATGLLGLGLFHVHEQAWSDPLMHQRIDPSRCLLLRVSRQQLRLHAASHGQRGRGPGEDAGHATEDPARRVRGRQPWCGQDSGLHLQGRQGTEEDETAHGMSEREGRRVHPQHLVELTTGNPRVVHETVQPGHAACALGLAVSLVVVPEDREPSSVEFPDELSVTPVMLAQAMNEKDPPAGSVDRMHGPAEHETADALELERARRHDSAR